MTSYARLDIPDYNDSFFVNKNTRISFSCNGTSDLQSVGAIKEKFRIAFKMMEENVPDTIIARCTDLPLDNVKELKTAANF